MRVQFCKAGPELVLETKVVEEVMLDYDLEQGMLVFAGRIGEEWEQIAEFDVLEHTANIGYARPREITSIFVSNSDAETLVHPGRPLAAFEDGVRSAAKFLEGNVNHGELLAKQVKVAHGLVDQ